MSDFKSYVVCEKKLTCSHCGNDKFSTTKRQLNTEMMTALKLDFLNHSAMCYVCSECSKIEWFFEPEVEK